MNLLRSWTWRTRSCTTNIIRNTVINGATPGTALVSGTFWRQFGKIIQFEISNITKKWATKFTWNLNWTELKLDHYIIKVWKKIIFKMKISQLHHKHLKKAVKFILLVSSKFLFIYVVMIDRLTYFGVFGFENLTEKWVEQKFTFSKPQALRSNYYTKFYELILFTSNY